MNKLKYRKHKFLPSITVMYLSAYCLLPSTYVHDRSSSELLQPPGNWRHLNGRMPSAIRLC